MKAEHLRIGNWVQFRHTETPVRITLGDFVREYNDEHLEDYEPIALTEEWLVKFGFPTIGQDREWYGIRLHNTCRREGCYHVVINGSKKVDVKHVHQLQNLFHSLTGEELTIKTIDPK